MSRNGVVDCYYICKKIIWERGESMFYELSFNYWDNDPANDDKIILAVYSSEEQKGLEKFKKNQDLQEKKPKMAKYWMMLTGSSARISLRWDNLK